MRRVSKTLWKVRDDRVVDPRQIALGDAVRRVAQRLHALAHPLIDPALDGDHDGGLRHDDAERPAAPSQGWLARMKAMTLTSVPSCISGEAIAAPANAPTASASAASMVTSVPRLGGSALAARGIGDAVRVEPLADQQHDAFADQAASRKLRANFNVALSRTTPRKPAHSQASAAMIEVLDETVDDQLLELERSGGERRNDQRQADQQDLLPAGHPPDRAVELTHRADLVFVGAWSPPHAKNSRKGW